MKMSRIDEFQLPGLESFPPNSKNAAALDGLPGSLDSAAFMAGEFFRSASGVLYTGPVFDLTYSLADFEMHLQDVNGTGQVRLSYSAQNGATLFVAQTRERNFPAWNFCVGSDLLTTFLANQYRWVSVDGRAWVPGAYESTTAQDAELQERVHRMGLFALLSEFREALNAAVRTPQMRDQAKANLLCLEENVATSTELGVMSMALAAGLT